ncbi:MAG: PQQ-binding-like beta-propeller repeat protein [bacterium]
MKPRSHPIGFSGAAARSLAFAVTLLTTGVAPLPTTAQELDLRFPTPNAPVEAILVDDSLVRIGGAFETFGPLTGAFTTFRTETGEIAQENAVVKGPFSSAEVRALAPDGAGGWFVGGEFSTVDGEARNDLVRILPDGSLSPWDPQVTAPSNYSIEALVVVGNTLYVAGSFTEIRGEPRRRLAAFAVDSGELLPWDPSPDSVIHDLVAYDGLLYVCGYFTNIGGASRFRIAALDPVTGLATPWKPLVSVAWNLAVRGDVVYVATTDGAVAFDRSTGQTLPWNLTVGDRIRRIVPTDDVVYVVGYFATLNGEIRYGMGAVDATTGANTSWNPNSGYYHSPWTCRDAVLHDNTLYVGGWFLKIGAYDQRYVVAVDATTGTVLPFDPNPDHMVASLAVEGSTLAMGGRFERFDQVARSAVAAFDPVTANLNAWNPDPNGAVHAIARNGQFAYLGGEFSYISGTPRSRVGAARISNALPTTWNPNVDSGLPGDESDVVRAIAVGNGQVYLGGHFGLVGGIARHDLAAVDPSSAVPTSWAPEPSGEVHALAVDGGVVYAGGEFVTIGGASRPYLAALDGMTGAATSWAPAPDGAVYAMLPTSTAIYVGGDFTTVGGAARAHVAAIDPVTGLAMPWQADTDGRVHALALDGDLLYVGGDFTTVGGQPRAGLASIDRDTGLVTSWEPGITGGAVHAIAVGDGSVYVGGTFTNAGGHRRDHFAVFRSTSVDAPVITPSGFALGPVRPNPLRAAGSVWFTLPRAERVSLVLHDVAGRRVRTLLHDESVGGGGHTLPFVRDDLAAGVYFLRLDAGGERATTKVVVSGR